MRPRRRTFNMTERCAILILRVRELEGRPVPRSVQKSLTAERICSFYDADHYPHKWTDGGPTHPSNGQMLVNKKGAAFFDEVDEHTLKTAKRDLPQLAKDRRIAEDNAEFRRRMLDKVGQPAECELTDKPKRAYTMRSGGFRKRPEGTRYNWQRGGRLERVDK